MNSSPGVAWKHSLTSFSWSELTWIPHSFVSNVLRFWCCFQSCHTGAWNYNCLFSQSFEIMEHFSNWSGRKSARLSKQAVFWSWKALVSARGNAASCTPSEPNGLQSLVTITTQSLDRGIHWVNCPGETGWSDKILKKLRYLCNTLGIKLKMSALTRVNCNLSKWQMAFKFFHHHLKKLLKTENICLIWPQR